MLVAASEELKKKKLPNLLAFCVLDMVRGRAIMGRDNDSRRSAASVGFDCLSVDA
jgi:hypothetical protein